MLHKKIMFYIGNGKSKKKNRTNKFEFMMDKLAQK